MCDLVVASETAQFGQPEVKIGIIRARAALSAGRDSRGEGPGHGAVLTGEPVSAAEAHARPRQPCGPAGAHWMRRCGWQT